MEFECGTTDSVSFDVGEFEWCPKIFKGLLRAVVKGKVFFFATLLGGTDPVTTQTSMNVPQGKSESSSRNQLIQLEKRLEISEKN